MLHSTPYVVMSTGHPRFRILLLGNGGREHAFAWKLNQSPMVERIVVIPGNGGTVSSLSKVRNFNLDLNKMDELVEFALDRGINLVIPSSEGPLVAGITDLFRAGSYFIHPHKGSSNPICHA